MVIVATDLGPVYTAASRRRTTDLKSVEFLETAPAGAFDYFTRIKNKVNIITTPKWRVTRVLFDVPNNVLYVEMLKYGILFLFCIIPYYTGIIPEFIIPYRSIEPCVTLNYRKFNKGYNPIVN